MRRRKYNLNGSAVIGLLSLVVAVWTPTLYAGDEDMSPTAYHVFDPETGYMITVDPEAEAQALATGGNVAPEVDASDVTSPIAWQILLAIAIVAGGIYVWRSKRRISRN